MARRGGRDWEDNTLGVWREREEGDVLVVLFPLWRKGDREGMRWSQSFEEAGTWVEVV